MKLFKKNSFILVPLVFILVGFFITPNKVSAVCDITQVNTRPYGVQPIATGTASSPDDFPGGANTYRNESNGYPSDGYNSNNPNFPPYVYVDVQTTGCQGQTVSILVMSLQYFMQIQNAGLVNPVLSFIVDLFSDPYAIGESIHIGPGTPLPPGHNSLEDSFTIVLKSGETGCGGQGAVYDCQYIFGILGSGVEPYYKGTFTQPQLEYDCDGVCGDSWAFMGVQQYNTSSDQALGGFTPGDYVYFTEGYDNYLAPLPGLPDQNCSTPPCSGLGPFLKALFTILIMLAGILAFIMLVIGGITYATANAIDGHSSGKDMMWNAVLGLIIALGAWVILNTINPKLASDLSITIPKATLDAPDEDWNNGNATSGTHIAKKHNVNGQPIVMGMAWPSDATQRATLTAANIQVNHENCPTAGANNCTSVYFNADNNVIDRIVALRSACANCVLVVTGGSEAWLHSSHGPEAKNVDLRNEDTLNSYLTGLPGGPQQSDAFPTCKTISVSGLGKFWAEAPACSSSGTVPHWHVTFN